MNGGEERYGEDDVGLDLLLHRVAGRENYPVENLGSSLSSS